MSIGLLPLTRTMAIAFVPALIAAGLVQVFAAEESRQRRLLAFSASLAFAALTAALWLVPNSASVFGYLLNFGYGARSAGHGVVQEHLLGFANLVYFVQTLGAYVYLANLLLILTGLALLLARTATLFCREGVAAGLRRLINSDALPPALLVLEGTLALASSQNKGSAFIAPLVPSMLILAAWGFLGWDKMRSLQLAAASLIVVVAAISAVPLLDLRLPLARPRLTELPVIGGIYVVDGRARSSVMRRQAVMRLPIPLFRSIRRPATPG